MLHGRGINMISRRNNYCLFLALCDGIENNDAFKHTSGDSNHHTWTQLLIDLQFFDEINDDAHMLELRRRFVVGACDWMAGKHGSMQNDKDILGYTDDEWAYIWGTMIEDRAWAVPGIKDFNGTVIKENNAPEIFINYIAHDLKCNIIVFDLVLDNIQFVSGNLLKADNVVFNSPLMMYSTGSHFQAVFQEDHEFFVNYAKQLQSEYGIPDNSEVDFNPSNKQEPHSSKRPGARSNKESGMGKSRTACMMPSRSFDAELSSTANTMSGSTAEARPKREAGKGSSNSSAYMKLSRVQGMGQTKTAENEQTEEDRHQKDMEVVPNQESYGRSEASGSQMNIEGDMADEIEFQMISKIRKKDRTPAQQKTFDRIRMKRKRKIESAAESELRKEHDRESRKGRRIAESAVEIELRRAKDREHKKQRREDESLTEKQERCSRNRDHMEDVRGSETEKQKQMRCSKDLSLIHI